MYHRHQDHESTSNPPPNLLPPVEQPKGAKFLFETWSGRLILVNLLMFILEVYLSPGRSLNEISYDVMIRLGAKDSVLLAAGEYWRFVTPMFLHGNLLHLLFNNWALFAVAYQVESLLGARKFLLLYFLAGIGGNILSALWTMNLSLGASGSLFGLLGCAWFFERTIHKKVAQVTGFKPKTGAYTVMVVANILFGFIIPQIDNAAHIGGLLIGILSAYVVLNATPNRLVDLHPVRARAAIIVATAVFLSLAALGASPFYVKWRIQRAAELSTTSAERYFLLGRYLQLEDSDRTVLWQHLRLALQLNDFKRAEADLKRLEDDPDFHLRIGKIQADLSAHDAHSLSWLNERVKPASE